MANALIPLANLTLSSSTASVTFSSIVNTYRDLMLIVSGSHTGSSTNVLIRVNGDTSSTYVNTGFANNSGTLDVSGGTYTGNVPITNSGGFSAQITIRAHIFDYAQTDKHKTIITTDGRGDGGVGTQVCRWPSTSAITTLFLYNQSGTNFAAGSSFALYGVSAL